MLRAQVMREALARYTPPQHIRMKGTKPPGKPDPAPTPIPPSASQIQTGHIQRYGIYSFNADGNYYYKREQVDSPEEIPKAIKALGLTYPLWAYVKSARTVAELGLMPIRISASALTILGQRFHKLKEKKA